ncbi:hypothetical protein GGH12_002659 [Coemansia sp. RSA 1822]|nr:hypothetical protein LPJ76_001868 [Coemansia sp. RSA 638]KAJ2124809.1 hypothetical protein IW147_001414 [Coemansia sp. RSA 720]KAJ2538966.1 hypothetical protein GGF49_005559 [Coemansia sp. RSA 1853]KAJ2563319.1 hypothetical protein GGH12_002659 [Coemansia sp. RSA 1822]
MATENLDNLDLSNLVCVFCGSSTGTDPSYMDAATQLGRELATQGYGLVYGGGTRGLMGQVARSTQANAAPVLGIMPRALMSVEGCANEIGRMLVVNNMHERKSKMNEYARAFIALPGGFGTLEELLEITTWSMLSIHSKPVIVLNTNGYYEPLKKMVEGAVEGGFVSKGNSGIILFCDTPEEAVKAIKTYVPPDTRYGLDWTTKVDI